MLALLHPGKQAYLRGIESSSGARMSLVILLAGCDPELLTQWAGPLVAAGYAVVSAADSSETIDKIFKRDFDLVLLCRSLTEDERRRLILILRIYTPETPVLMIGGPEDVDYQYGVRAVPGIPDRIVAAVQTSLC